MSTILKPDELKVLSDYGCSPAERQRAEDFFALLTFCVENGEADPDTPHWIKVRPGVVHRSSPQFKHSSRARLDACFEDFSGFAVDAEEQTGGRPATVWFLHDGFRELTPELRLEILRKHLLVKFGKIAEPEHENIRCPKCGAMPELQTAASK